jgi:transporter family-2 protein
MSNKKDQRLDILATISGVMIALQARANGELSHRLNNGVEAALISFGSGLLIIAIVAIFSPAIKEGARNLRGAVVRKELPRWTLFAGALGGTFVAIQTHVVPVIGVAIYSVASIAGQTAASLLVDRLGITGGGKKQRQSLPSLQSLSRSMTESKPRTLRSMPLFSPELLAL